MTKELTDIKVSPITRLRGMLDSIAQMADGVSMFQTWKHVFNLETDSRLDVYPHLYVVKNLIDECKIAINDFTDPEKHEIYLTEINRLNNIYNESLDQNVTKIKSKFQTETFRARMEICEIEVSRNAYEHKIAEEEISDLIQLVNDLTDRIADAEIDPKIKILTIELLASIKNALIDYKIGGIETVQTTIEKEIHNIDFVFRNLSDSGDEGTVKQFIKQVGGLVVKACKTYQYSTTIYAISSDTKDFVQEMLKLGSGSG